MDAWLLKWKYVLWYFSFFCQCYGTRVSADRFFRVPIFHPFYPKISAHAYFNSVFSNNGWPDRKTMKAVWFSIIKTFNFYAVTIKTGKINQNYHQNWSKLGDLDRRTEKHYLKVPTLPPSPPKKTPLFSLKKTATRFLAVKISVPTNFMCLR